MGTFIFIPPQGGAADLSVVTFSSSTDGGVGGYAVEFTGSTGSISTVARNNADHHLIDVGVGDYLVFFTVRGFVDIDGDIDISGLNVSGVAQYLQAAGSGFFVFAGAADPLQVSSPIQCSLSLSCDAEITDSTATLTFVKIG